MDVIVPPDQECLAEFGQLLLAQRQNKVGSARLRTHYCRETEITTKGTFLQCLDEITCDVPDTLPDLLMKLE